MGNLTYFEKLGQQIAKVRKRKKLSQTDLARKTDKDRQSIHRLEKGQVNPTVKYLKEVADALGVAVRRFFDFE